MNRAAEFGDCGRWQGGLSALSLVAVQAGPRRVSPRRGHAAYFAPVQTLGRLYDDRARVPVGEDAREIRACQGIAATNGDDLTPQI